MVAGAERSQCSMDTVSLGENEKVQEMSGEDIFITM